MASIGLLEVLKLTDYYPQKLSFSEAIKLRGKSQHGSQEQCGLDIVRKLLLSDSTAVVSVATEINNRLNDTDNKEAVRPTGKSNVRPSWRTDQRKLHPMDLLIAVMNCCDDFLRQILVEKMFSNMISVPILLPGIRNGSCTLLLLALRSLVPEAQEQIQIRSSDSLTDTLVDRKNPFVSFLRVGNLHRSKSKLLNELLYLISFNTFFHRECQEGSAKRAVSNGSIEAAWFQSPTASEEELKFNCRFFTALNLRGDARDYPKQTQFLCQSSTLTVFMVDSFKPFKDLYENVFKDIDVPQTKIIICLISPESPDNVDENDFVYLEELSERGTIFKVIYDWCDGTKKMSDVDFTNDLRKSISEFFKPKHENSKQIGLPSYANVSLIGKNLGFSLDDDKSDCRLAKEKTDKFVDLLLKQSSDRKTVILPLQGEPWQKIGQLERQQRGKSQDNTPNEYFIAEKETEKRRQRQKQCYSLIQQNDASLTVTFSFACQSLKDQALLYYINSCKIKLDARSRDIISTLIKECKDTKHGHDAQMLKEEDREIGRCQSELQTANCAIGLEHFLREHGQMYEAVISEEELGNARLSPDCIRNFPAIVASLLLMGQPLELMDGDSSNVPITWVKAVLNQVAIMTNNAKVFVLSIIGVQSSGKSTLLNALFGLQFPVSAGRCTKGIYCHLVPIDKGSLQTEYDYVLVVDTEGLGASQFAGNSTLRDNELATFAIGLADATIINMKGENWSEMKDILQVVAYGLIRVRKTKRELKLMPICMFVHQNVSAVDAKAKNQLGQENQLMLLDNAVKEACRKEGFTEITKFNQVIKYDSELHSWYFPDLWNGSPPTARISQDYIGKVNELHQHLEQVMKNNPSKLTISGFFLRMSDLWNAMLHNDFVLCFRNTQEIMSGTVLNDKISNEMDVFKNRNKSEQGKTRKIIHSLKCIEDLNADKDGIVSNLIDAVNTNFTNMETTLETVITGSDINDQLKGKYKDSLNILKDGEIHRIRSDTLTDLGIQMKKLENYNDEKVKELKVRLTALEKSIGKEAKEKFSDTMMIEFKEKWQELLAEDKKLVDERMKLVENEIKQTISRALSKLSWKDKNQVDVADWTAIIQQLSIVEMPKVLESDIVLNSILYRPSKWANELKDSESYAYKANRGFHDAHKKWELQFQNQRDQQFNASDLEQVLSEVGHLLGIEKKKQETGDICFVLPSGCKLTPDYTNRFMTFACQYTYNRSLENSKRFISLTDPLADIEERRHKSISYLQQMTVEANINGVSDQIFQYAKMSFVDKLGELIKTEVCKEENKVQTFKTKRAFLRTILTDLGQRTDDLTEECDEKKFNFEQFMLYVELANTYASEDFFLSSIKRLLIEMLTKEYENKSETDFQKMVKNNVGKTVEKAKNSLRHAETKSEGCAKKYVQIFKDCMNVANEIDIRINTLDGFTKAVLGKVDMLYSEFLGQANASFEALIWDENKAAVRQLFEKIMGCQEKCPFCSAPCYESLDKHAGDHRANHYPMGVRGTVEIKGVFANTHQTYDVTMDGPRKPEKLTVVTCQTIVGTRADFRTQATMEKFDKWYHRRFNCNYESFKNYKEIAEYKNWDIPHSQDHKTSLYWKWFMAQYVVELSARYRASRPEIPAAWRDITWKEASVGLDGPGENFQFEV